MVIGKRLLAGLNDMEHAADARRPDKVAEAADPGGESVAIAGVAQGHIGEVDNRLGRHHPTLPSRLMPISFCASTANSTGSCWMTSLAKRRRISALAPPSGMPRCMT